MADIDADRARRGLAPSTLASAVEPWAVFVIRDLAVHFPAERLPDAGARSRHSGRPVIVVGSLGSCLDDGLPTVLIVPCSASVPPGRTLPYDVRIPNGTPGFTKSDVVAFTSLVQPILKSDFKERTGELPDHVRALVEAALRKALAR